MKKLIHLVIVSVLLATTHFVFASKNNFQFQISNYATQRQGGQTLDLFVRYAMKDGVDYEKYPDYRDLRSKAMKHLEPENEQDINTYWEILASKIGDELMGAYPLSGVSVQILTYPNDAGTVQEPGFHGPIYTVGDVIPLSQVVMPSHSSQAKNGASSQVKVKIKVNPEKVK